MKVIQTRRCFLAALGSASAASLIDVPAAPAQQAPPETTTIRICRITGVCVAPLYVAEEMLRAEGFTDIQYVDTGVNPYAALAAGNSDIGMAFVANFIVHLDMGAQIVLLGGVHTGCYELFGTEHVRALRDLKGRTVAVPELGSSHYLFLSSMLAYVGLDPHKDVNFVIHPADESVELLAERKIDALMAFPPVPQELRERKIGHAVFNSGLDRPWSQYFCCTVGASRAFARRNPVAAKRALRAILKSAQFCSADPERAAGIIANKGYRYEHVLQALNEIRYTNWREYDPDDAVRFYALRLREAGMIKAAPNKIIADGTDWRFFNELKRELKG
jgi:NitT/TauT family transport system substrate-binding protein